MRVVLCFWGFIPLLLFSCSSPMMRVEYPVVDGYLKVVELSDEGAVKPSTANFVKLPTTVTGKSDIVVRDKRIYIGSYKSLLLLEQSTDGLIQLVSSLSIDGYDVSLALHPQEEIVYLVNNEGIWVVDVADMSKPTLVERLLLMKEMEQINPALPIRDAIGTDVACEDGKLVLTIQGVGKSPTLSRSGTVLVFDVSDPHHPRLEKILESLSGAAAVAMGIVNHQIFAVGDKLVEYQNFKSMDTYHDRTSPLWLRQPREGQPDRVEMPGDVVDVEFVFSPQKDIENPEKLRALINQYRRASPSERKRLQILTPLAHGIVYIATENAVTLTQTSFMTALWGPDDANNYVSDRFNHIYGMAVHEYQQVFLAAGTEGVYRLNWPLTHTRLNIHARYEDLPSPAIDVYVRDDRLYILCGELHLKNVQHNERFGSKQ